MKKSLLGVVLCVAVLISVIGAALAMPTFAAGEIDLLVNAYSNGNGSTVTAENGVVSADITTPWDAASDAAYGIAVEPQITGFDMTNQGYVHIKLNATTPFRITLLDRGANGDKWISFGSEFFNTIVTVGSEAGTSAPANGFFAAGEYDCVAYLGGVYSWKTNNGEAGWDITNTNITALYIEAKTEGNITIEHFALSSDGTCNCVKEEPTTTTESTTEATTETTTEATTTESTKATTAIPEDAFIVYTIETVEVEGPVAAGDEVVVEVSTSAASQIAGIGLNIAYDPAVLEVVSAEEAGWFAGLGMSDINVMESEIRMSCMDLAGATSAEGEVIATLTFKAVVDLAVGETVELYALTSDVVSTDVLATVTGHCTDGAIVVVEPAPIVTEPTTEPTAEPTEPSTTETEPSTTETEPSTTETEPSATETTKGTESTATTATTTKANESPKTGDASNALLLVVIAAAAAVVLTASVKKAQAR